MKALIQFLFILSLFFSSGILFSQNSSSVKENKIEAEDIKKLLGEWSGSLTYLDYSSGNLYPMPCDLIVNEKRKNRKLVIKYIYPDEPKANSKGKIKFSKDGTLINNKRIRSKSINSDGQLELVTQSSGKDGNDGKKAMIKHIYKIGDSDLIIRKEIKHEDSNDWIMRNEYKLKKK